MKKLIFVSLLILSPLTSYAARTASSDGWYRAEGGITLSGDFSSFDETKSGSTYENSLYGYSIGGFYRAGLRFNAIAFGITGSVDALSGALGRKAADGSGTTSTFGYDMLQALGGGFVGVTLWSGASGPEIFGEYYALAHRTVSDEKSAGSPMKKHDALNGKGWGAGISFMVDPRFRFGIMYRKLTFDNLNLSGTADPVARTEMQTQQGMLFISTRM